MIRSMDNKKTKTIPEREEEILKFWEKHRIFEASLKKNKGKKAFIFYEGPPTANGMPGIHHVEARAFKDAVLRYKTMQGFFAARRAGWDTHGLPVEIQVEKKLGFKSKQEIENFGIARFNAEAKQSVWEYKEVWERLTRRMGFWVDMAHPYITYETSYIESLWWIIKEFWKKKLLYEDFKVVPWCPRCQTGLSSHEVGLGYQEIKDTAVYVKFKLLPNQKIGEFTTDDRTYVLAWTTTPWTLPGNVGLAVGEGMRYLVIDHLGLVSTADDFSISISPGKYVIAEEALQHLFRYKKDQVNPFSGLFDMVAQDEDYNKLAEGKGVAESLDIKHIMGVDLKGVVYQPLFSVEEFKKSETAYKIYQADFVSATEGTGVVHTAVMYGEDDYQLGKKVGLPTFHTVTEDGRFISEVSEVRPAIHRGRTSSSADFGALGGLSVKASETTKKILEILGDKVFHQEEYKHEYPHCWRCSTPLLYYARKAWWVRTTAVKKELLANNEKISWIPGHLQHGRFGEFLRDVRDWCFSRERYWGTPLPIWKCEKCGEIEVIGSTEELKKRGGALPRDEKKEINLHRPYVDEIVFVCAKKDCGGMMRRTPEVADVWFDSGAMPFAQSHYPFSSYEIGSHRSISGGLDVRKLAFPADYICEGVDQTRGWFYSMLNVATLLGRGTPYKNVISMGILLDKNGEKMSKSKGNIVVPQEMADKYGMDALRWYFFTINAPGDEKRFEEKDVALRQRGFVATLWNSFVFWDTYVSKIKSPSAVSARARQKLKDESKNILDQWILARLNILIEYVTTGLDQYDLVGAARMIDEFAVNDFSQWFVRRSRRRFQHPETSQEKNQAAAVMAQVLLILAELAAPFTPFISEAVYQGLRKKMPGSREESVHLRVWPKSEKRKVKREKLVKDMEVVRGIVAEALKLRAEAGIKVRQPLAKLQITNDKLQKELLVLITNEMNVKEIVFGNEIKLDIEITPELREEGMAREIIRNIQEMRRELYLTPKQRVDILITRADAVLAIEVKYRVILQKETNSRIVARGVGRKPPRAERVLQFADGELQIEIL